LISDVIYHESTGNPRAVSKTGAQGLMQLEPGTAKDMGVANAFDPRQNVIGGSRYLRSLIDRYRGNVPYALAAYNEGPENFEKGILPDETRAYVEAIMRDAGRFGA
jgi:soluble lytic murein transglycosylase-like protein